MINITSGIYGYWDNEKGYYVYVGKDNNIDTSNNRDYHHNLLSEYNHQVINRVLQNNPERYEYRVIIEGNYDDWELNQMEKLCIKSFKTFKYDYPNRSVFNFTRGGEGISGYRKPYEDSKYTVAKAGKKGFSIYNRLNKQIKTCKDKSKLEPIAEALNNDEITEEEAKAIKIKLNPFVYTVSKAGKKGFQIYNRSNQRIKVCKDKSKLEAIAEALNNGEITEEEVKSVRGADKVLEMLNEIFYKKRGDQ